MRDEDKRRLIALLQEMIKIINPDATDKDALDAAMSAIDSADSAVSDIRAELREVEGHLQEARRAIEDAAPCE